MEKFLIPQDKANHIIYGLLIFIISGFFLNDFYSFVICLLFAFAKEVIHDFYFKRGTPDIVDFLATICLPLLLIFKTFILC